MGAVEELRVVTDQFRAARFRCDAVLVGCPGVSHRDRHSIGAIGSDIEVWTTQMLPRAVEDVLEAWRAQVEEIQAGKWPSGELPQFGPSVMAARTDPERMRPPTGVFRVSVKCMYFLVRSLQDALYRVFVQVILGRATGRKDSMASILKAENPVALSLPEEFLEEYRRWFEGWRALRNRIKLGQGGSLLGSFEPGSPRMTSGSTSSSSRMTAGSSQIWRGAPECRTSLELFRGRPGWLNYLRLQLPVGARPNVLR